MHCVKRVSIRSYSGQHFPAFGLNTERYGVSLRVHIQCEKMWTRITPNTDTCYAVMAIALFYRRFRRRHSTLVFSMFPFDPPENIRKPKVSKWNIGKKRVKEKFKILSSHIFQ